MRSPPLPADAILRYVAAHGPVDTVTLAAHFGVRHKHAFARLRELAQEGLVARVGRFGTAGGRGVMVWCMPGSAPDEPDDDADDERDTAPIVQRRIAAGAWQVAPGPAARWFDAVVR